VIHGLYPKVRPGTYFPALLQRRRRAEHALLAVIQEAWVHGVPTRKVDDSVKALGVAWHPRPVVDYPACA
jgi:transposase-like protein